ncbi:hypothetical protein AMTR_s00143p00108440 [Amborella trichopoda]|uniref:Reverse transcriptase RNase H-like domain-containing protein n=1 Tax=Amborella trichopoda TaxID=13333 RepID=W1PEE8_AMBTC|nr:hypothetical protein AMTR_s00143p00108440 [Amborella trichopoda]
MLLPRATTSKLVLCLQTSVGPSSLKVHTNASDYAIGGMLMQEWHPVAFISRKLNEPKQHFNPCGGDNNSKEMTTEVHCLKAWQYNLQGKANVVADDLSQKMDSTVRVAVVARGAKKPLRTD